MNREDIIKLAQEAGFEGMTGHPVLERFAALVAAAEREACARVCEDEAWRLKKVAIDTGSRHANMRAIQASNDADDIRARGNT